MGENVENAGFIHVKQREILSNTRINDTYSGINVSKLLAK
jgi:hypothetical protein